MQTSREKTIIMSSHYKKYRNDRPTSFTVHLDNSVDISDVSRSVIKSVHFPNLFPNIDTYNNTLYFNVGASSYTVTLPVGRYSVATLMSTLQGAIDASGATTVTSISHDQDTYQLTIVTADPIVFLSDWSIVELTGSVSSLNNTIGGPAHDDTTAATTTVLPGVLNLSGPTQIHVVSETIAGGHCCDSKGDSRSVVCIVPVDVPWGSTVHWTPQSHLLAFVDYNGDRNLSTIDVKLTTTSGEPLTMPDNAHVEIELMAVYRS